MRLRVGIAVTGTDIRAVGVRRGRVEWGLQSDVVEGETLSESIAALLSAAPLTGWPRPLVFVALGAPFARVKPLVGLPEVKQPRLLARTLCENVDRFFLGGGRLVAGGVRSDSDGRVWGSAFEASAIDAILGSCASRGLAVKTVVPAVAIVPVAVAGESIHWLDGSLATHLTARDGRLIGLQHLTDAHEFVETTHGINPKLTPLGADAPRYAAAYGALERGASESLGIVPGQPMASMDTGVPRWRVVAAALALLASSAAALAAPGVASARVSEAARAELATLAQRRRTALAINERLTEKTTALTRIAEFDATRRPALALLADVARLLPPDAALVTFRVDSVGGTLVALAPRAGAVISRLEKSARLAAPEMIGPVTREVAAGREYERVTVRFRFAPRSHRPATATAGSPE